MVLFGLIFDNFLPPIILSNKISTYICKKTYANKYNKKIEPSD